MEENLYSQSIWLPHLVPYIRQQKKKNSSFANNRGTRLMLMHIVNLVLHRIVPQSTPIP
jgi:hypothetical protein